MGVGQACDSKRLQTTERRSAKHKCRMACASVVYYYECRELRVRKHFVEMHNHIVFVFVRFFCMLYMCLYCALHIWRIIKYLSIYLSIYLIISTCFLCKQNMTSLSLLAGRTVTRLYWHIYAELKIRGTLLWRCTSGGMTADSESSDTPYLQYGRQVSCMCCCTSMLHPILTWTPELSRDT